jgi:cyclopropane-fatty-acyl-phospholipid synthase
MIPAYTKSKQTEFTAEKELYQQYSNGEYKERINFHYERPVEFYYPILGGDWNVYSCNLWDQGATNDTESQEAKLDLMAQLMELKPGQRILDVGCGWGGPLTYLCHKYGVEGVGLTTSPIQRAAAEKRIAKYGVKAEIKEVLWQDFQDERGFDAIYTDEVIVHFNDLLGFFKKAHSLLHDGGHMVNKELHFSHPIYSRMSRAMLVVHEIYGLTGNYRPLGEELTLTNQAGFEVRNVRNIDISNYLATATHWHDNMHANQKQLVEAAGIEFYKHFRKYLKIIHGLFKGPAVTLDIVASRKLSDLTLANGPEEGALKGY